MRTRFEMSSARGKRRGEQPGARRGSVPRSASGARSTTAWSQPDISGGHMQTPLEELTGNGLGSNSRLLSTLRSSTCQVTKSTTSFEGVEQQMRVEKDLWVLPVLSSISGAYAVYEAHFAKHFDAAHRSILASGACIAALGGLAGFFSILAERKSRDNTCKALFGAEESGFRCTLPPSHTGYHTCATEGRGWKPIYYWK
jgi:hypothetical protein